MVKVSQEVGKEFTPLKVGQVHCIRLEGRGEAERGKRILTSWVISDPSSCPTQNSSNQALRECERPSLPATEQQQ